MLSAWADQLCWGDLAAMHVLTRTMGDRQAITEWFAQADADVKDNVTEYGGLIVVGDLEGISHLLSGGIRLDIDYTPALLYQVAKMDGAIVLNSEATKIAWANVQLMPDPTILSSETGTRHRTADAPQPNPTREKVH